MLIHTLVRETGKYKCTVCLKSWKSKPANNCPGLPVHDFGHIPEGLCPFDDLFERGLTLGEHQKPTALLGPHQTKLYALDECVPHHLDIRFDQGKYKFLETSDGFDIYRVNGLKVSVTYESTWLGIRPGHRHASRLGLYDWQLALHRTAEDFARALVPEDVAAAAEMIEKALSYRFFQGWQRIIREIAPKDVCDLARRMWASAQTDSAVLHQPALYNPEHKNTRTDLLRYHACRLYAATTDSLDDVSHWRERLSPTVPNKALNKTLDGMPVGISFRQITRLSTIQLTHPVTKRLHLLFILCASDHHNWGMFENIVVNATPEMIQEAARLHDMPLSGRSKTRDIGNLAERILDWPDPYGGDLLGLARLSARWHARMANGEQQPSGALPASAPLALPPGIDLAALEHKNIKLLRTAGDCYAEHAQMRHCVHTYASKAHHGLCYLFHAEHTAGDVTFHATVEVSPVGKVVQAKGLENMRNPACDYGLAILQDAFQPYPEQTPGNHPSSL